MPREDDYTDERDRMVEDQLRARDIVERRVLDAMRLVPRHRFVRPADLPLAYADGALPIDHRQTISQPYIVALMTQLLELEPNDTVLEVGTGSGYQAAVLSKLARRVYTLERIPELAERARSVLTELGMTNVEVRTGDGSLGLPEHAPYPAIIVTAAAPRVPEALKEQLAEGGRLVVPVGSRDGQMLERWTRSEDKFDRERIAPVAFVPLLGDQGWGADALESGGWFFGF